MKSQKQLSIVLILLLPVLLFGQDEKYKSQEETDYYKDWHHRQFKPLSRWKILNFKSPYISREKLHHFTPYSDSLYYTKYQDSVKNVIFNPSNKGPIIIPKPQYIGKIERGSILKYDKKGPIRAFIFESDLFDSYLSQEPGLWVAYSSDDGNSWEYLYTGIVQRQPICLKWYSAIPLIKSENELQIEACLLRQLTPFYSLDYRPTYKLIKDRLKVTLD